jgi:hypothetical protein
MKCLLKLSVLFVLALVLLVGGTFLGIESLMSTAITESVGYVTQQETQLDDVDVVYGEKLIGFQELTVANPVGFQEVPLVRVGNISAQFAPTIMRGEAVHLKEVKLENLELALELKGSLSNLSDLLKRLDELNQAIGDQTGQTTPDQPSGTDPDDGAGKGAATTFHIDRIKVSGVKASLRITDVPLIDGIYNVEVPDMLLEDFDSSMEEAELSEWTSHIVAELLANTLAAGDGVFPSEWQSLLSSDLSAALLRGDLGGAEGLLQGQLQNTADKLLKDTGLDGIEAVEDAKDDLLKSLDKKVDLNKLFKD